MNKLIPQDIPELRCKCAICGYELTYAEFLYLDDRCVFHASTATYYEGSKRLRTLSIWSFLWHAFNELIVTRGKVAMLERGLSHIDYMATVGEVGEELHTIDSKGLKRLVTHMRAHGRT